MLKLYESFKSPKRMLYNILYSLFIDDRQMQVRIQKNVIEQIYMRATQCHANYSIFDILD